MGLTIVMVKPAGRVCTLIRRAKDPASSRRSARIRLIGEYAMIKAARGERGISGVPRANLGGPSTANSAGVGGISPYLLRATMAEQLG